MGCCVSCCKSTAPLPPMKKIENGSAHVDVAGSTVEVFFDSRAWLDSESESDFLSMRGEFTPSSGTSPDLQVGSMRRNNLPTDFDASSDSQSEHSPRITLDDFFHGKNHDNAVNGHVQQQNE